MLDTIPYTAMIEQLDNTIVNAIDTLEGDRDIAIAMDVITDEESERVIGLLELLEQIRGVINEI